MTTIRLEGPLTCNLSMKKSIHGICVTYGAVDYDVMVC